MNWFQRLFHHCETPNPDTFAPIEGREWSCPGCGHNWVYETKVVLIETEPAVWDRWANYDKETVTAWWKKD